MRKLKKNNVFQEFRYYSESRETVFNVLFAYQDLNNGCLLLYPMKL